MRHKTSLEKSHSKSSNAKLTLACVLGAIFFGLLWLGLLGGSLFWSQTIRWIVVGIGGVGCLLTIALLAVFKR